jgi:serine/threonine protein kinase
VETPEQVDHRADIYSLGVVFYELLTGELPLGRFPAPSIKAGLDARVDDIVFRALAKERELRQQTADQVRAEVEGLGGTESQERDEPVKRVPIWRRFGPWTSSRVVGAVSVALLAAWALLTVTVRFLQQNKAHADRIAGVNRLKDIGLALKTFEFEGLISNINTLTDQPVVIFGTDLTDTSPNPIIAVALGGPDLKNPTVLFGDGAVLPMSEAQFRQSLSRASPSYRANWEHFQQLGLFGRKDQMTDPRTGKPYLFFLAISGTNSSPDEMLAVSPPDPDTQVRSVLLGDGSVQPMSEERFRALLFDMVGTKLR